MLDRIRWLLTPPVFEDEDRTRTVRLLFLLTNLTFLLLVIQFFFFIIIRRQWDTAALIGLSWMCIVMVVVLARHGQVRQACILLAAMVWILIVLRNTVDLTAGQGLPSYTTYLVPIIASSFLVGTRSGLMFAGLSSLTALAATFYYLAIYPQSDVPGFLSTWAVSSGIYVFCALFMDSASHSLKDALKRARENEQNLLARNLELSQEMKARAEAEEAYRAVVEHSLQGLVILQEGKVVFVNQAASQMIGYTPAEIIEENSFTSFIHPDDAPKVVQHFRDRIAGQPAPDRYEFRAVRKDGSHYWIEVSPKLFTYHGKPAVQVALIDITERKQQENHLRDSAVIAQHFQKQLLLLQEVSIELANAGSMDELFRRAVEMGREKLEFERLGILLVDEANSEMIGTFGTDKDGNLCDERGLRVKFEPASILGETLTRRQRFHFEADTVLYDNFKPVGRGWNALALLWEDEQVLGWIAADNLLTGTPLKTYQVELLTLYGSIIGHLMTRQKAMDALRESESRLRMALSAAGMLTWDWDVEKNSFTYTGTNFAQDTSYRTLSYEQVMERIHPDDRNLVAKALRESADAVQNYEIEYRGLRRDGSDYWVMSQAQAQRDSTGRVVRLIGVLQNISERRRAEEALKRSEERFSKAFYLNPYPYALLDRDGYYLDVNESWLKVFGFTREQVIGRSARDMNIWVDVQGTEEFVRQLTEQGLVQAAEVRYRKTSGEVLTTVMTAVQIDLDGERCYLSMTQDITELKAAEQQRLELTLAQERVQMFEEFMGNISHDLKTPLTVINTTLYLLEHITDRARQIEKLGVIKQQTGLLDKFIQDILTISRLNHAPELVLDEVDVSLILGDIVERLTPAAEQKRILTRIDMAAEDIYIQADIDELNRVLVNLVENAINYTPEDGVVTIRTMTADGRLMLEVKDTGIGIQPDELPHIFNRFYRADEARSTHQGGTGLGLAIVKRIVEMHNGDIEVESQPGIGSTFRVWLPVQQKRAPAQAS